ncbi:MAG TPA: hypothetical protein VG890_13565 [Puia sp.]|nr:hypothetical protein [Puia sp.]
MKRSATHIILLGLFTTTLLSVKAQTPILNSYPAAAATVYLDFNGGVVDGSLWNEHGKIVAEPAGLAPTTIAWIHKKIAAHFTLFNLNITTDPAVYERAPVHQRIRIIFTPEGDWWGPAPGVSAIGSFAWGDDTPAWVFLNYLSGNPDYIAASATHQIGHTLGLQHQSVYDSYGIMISELSGGENNVLSNEAPLMGIPFYKTASWSSGTPSTGPGSIQNDTTLIAGSPNGIGYRKSLSAGAPAKTMDGIHIEKQYAGTIELNSTDDYAFRLYDISGRLLTQGTLRKGWNQIQATTASEGVLILQWYGDSASGSEKIMRQ